jgi:cephalosporin hydroxylase
MDNMTKKVERLFQLCMPQAISSLNRRFSDMRRAKHEIRYWQAIKPDEIKTAVARAIKIIESLTDKQCNDHQYIENEIIPTLGLNHELPHQYPENLKNTLGKGMHIWQYPNQFAPFLCWLSKNATQSSVYMEIGARWGGTFIVISEFLRRINPNFKAAIAVDPISASPLIKAYVDMGRAQYVEKYSNDPEFFKLLLKYRPDFVFIDGDHSLRGVMNDFALCNKLFVNTMAFHDIASDCCRDTTFFWNFAKENLSEFEAFSFDEQYPSIPEKYMGIGVLRRRLGKSNQ